MWSVDDTLLYQKQRCQILVIPHQSMCRTILLYGFIVRLVAKANQKVKPEGVSPHRSELGPMYWLLYHKRCKRSLSRFFFKHLLGTAMLGAALTFSPSCYFPYLNHLPYFIKSKSALLFYLMEIQSDSLRSVDMLSNSGGEKSSHN